MNFDIAYIIILLMVVLFFVFRQTKNKTTINIELYKVLEFPKIIKYLGYLCLSTIMIILVKDFSKIKSTDIIPIIILIILVIMVSTYLILLVNLKKVFYNNYSIIGGTLLGKTTELTWDKITNVELNKFSGQMKLYGNNKQIKVSTLYIGYEQFYHLVKLKEFI